MALLGGYKPARRFIVHQLRSSLTALLLSVVTITAIIYHFAEQTLVNTVKESLQYHADFRTDRIYALLNQQKEWMRKSVEDEHFRNRVEWLGASFSRGEDDPWYRFSHTKFRKEFDLLLKQQGVEDLLLITEEGRLFFSLRPMEEELGVDLTETGFYGRTILSELIQQVVERRSLVISHYGKIEQIEDSSVLMGMPLVSNFPGTEGELIAIMVRPLALGQLRALLESYSGLGESGEVMVAQMRGSHLHQGINFINHFRNSDRRQPDQQCQQLRSNNPQRFPMSHALKQKNSAGWLLDNSCREIYAIWRWLPELEWGMVVKQDREEVLAPVGTLQRNILLASLLILLFLFWIVQRQARAMVHPIEQLTHAAEQGDIAAHRAGEVVEVNHLAETLQRRSAELLRAKQETELILESMNDGLVVVNGAGEIQHANPMLEQLLGVSVIQLVGNEVSHYLDMERQMLLVNGGATIPVSISQLRIPAQRDRRFRFIVTAHSR